MSYLDVRNISKIIGSEQVLSNVDFSVERGQVVGLEGKNGSGKTMAMRVVCGLVRPDAGTVEIDRKLLWRDLTFPPSVGLLIEAPALLGAYSGIDNLRLLASIRRVATEQDLRRSLERMGLDPDDRKRARKYSLGMKQRLGIAMALMEAPDLLILDEPTNALDERGVEELVWTVGKERSRGAAILLSSHDPDFLTATCDAVYHMASGNVKGFEEVERHAPEQA